VELVIFLGVACDVGWAACIIWSSEGYIGSTRMSGCLGMYKVIVR
jgi:hypothetical protein